jgi:hypothetical protein
MKEKMLQRIVDWIDSVTRIIEWGLPFGPAHTTEAHGCLYLYSDARITCHDYNKHMP